MHRGMPVGWRRFGVAAIIVGVVTGVVVGNSATFGQTGGTGGTVGTGAVATPVPTAEATAPSQDELLAGLLILRNEVMGLSEQIGVHHGQMRSRTDVVVSQNGAISDTLAQLDAAIGDVLVRQDAHTVMLNDLRNEIVREPEFDPEVVALWEELVLGLSSAPSGPAEQSASGTVIEVCNGCTVGP